MNRVRRRVAGLLDEFLRLDYLDDFRLLGIHLGIQDVNPRRPDARHDQVATLHVRMRGLWTEARAASVPAKMVQLIIAAGKIYLPDEPAILRRTRLEVNDAYGIPLSIPSDVEQCNIREVFGRSLHCHAR